ncbi:MAG: GNAT family N-acetyltransferase [Enterococcus lacertideformus]|uniref:GNAT family N-acetyltransferase n=1 Tax=Enterococcus lacertideformus TaxID=2771493 RepID=A0A931B0C5_9ENTE|nr:GNAT family N-acetyltransferase [Enterococcus lacertideformus]
MSLVFRKTTLEDVPAVMKVINDAKSLLAINGSPQWQNGYPNEETIKQDIQKSWGYVFLVDGIVAGTLALQKTPDKNYQKIFEGSWEKAKDPYTTIHRIALSEDFRGQKLAYRLIEFAESETKMLGMSQIRVDTHKKNIGMQRIMNHCGFTLCGIVYVDDYVDNERLAYQKLIE